MLSAKLLLQFSCFISGWGRRN